MDFDGFHLGEVPALLAAGHGSGAAVDIGDGRSLALRLPDGRAYTYRAVEGDMQVVPGDHAEVVVELGEDAFEDLISEAWSVFGLLYSDRLQLPVGMFTDFARWEAPLQALWFGRPIYDPASAGPFDLSLSFHLDEGDAIREFLASTGFAVLRGVFAAHEIDALNAVVNDELVGAAPGDGRSWWAARSEDTEVCCRLTYMAERSPVVARLATDQRLSRIASLADPDLRPCTDRLDGVSVVIKHHGIVSGLSDLPWHRDCGVGGHPVLCPGLNVGIQLDRANADNGQLHFLAGSHHHAAQQGPPPGPCPTVAVDTEPGDVTVHYSHVLHAAPPPSSPTAGRKALYVGYHGPRAFEVVGPGEAYNDVLVKRDAGRVKSPDEVTIR